MATKRATASLCCGGPSDVLYVLDIFLRCLLSSAYDNVYDAIQGQYCLHILCINTRFPSSTRYFLYKRNIYLVKRIYILITKINLSSDKKMLLNSYERLKTYPELFSLPSEEKVHYYLINF